MFQKKMDYICFKFPYRFYLTDFYIDGYKILFEDVKRVGVIKQIAFTSTPFIVLRRKEILLIY